MMQTARRQQNRRRSLMPLFLDAVELVECFAAPHEASFCLVALLYELKLTPNLVIRNIACVTMAVAP